MSREQQATRDPQDARDFARSVAHTLNNLVQVIHGNLELIEARVPDDAVRGYLRNAQMATDELAALAADLHDRAIERP